MKDTIMENLKQIEKSYNVKMIYACEVGSRSWGLASQQSDFDVRFIYVHPKEFYLSIDPIGVGKKRDVIELPQKNELDFHGWDLTKTLRLLRKSNPSLLEWLHSPIVYLQANQTMEQIIKMLPFVINHRACIFHYVNMAKSNFLQYQKSPDIKILINILRPLLIANWIRNYNEFPSLSFQILVDTLIDDELLKTKIKALIKTKIHSNYNTSKDFNLILPYCLNEIDRLKNLANSLSTGKFTHTETLNNIFRKTLQETWT